MERKLTKVVDGTEITVGGKCVHMAQTWQMICVHGSVSTHVETVVLLSQQKPDDVIEVEIELDELDLTSTEENKNKIWSQNDDCLFLC